MKKVASLRPLAAALACLAVTGCHKSVDERYAEMHDYQLKHDRQSAEVGAEAWKYRAKIPDQLKEETIKAYAEVRKAREDMGLDDAK